jgi:hypothetical protein
MEFFILIVTYKEFLESVSKGLAGNSFQIILAVSSLLFFILLIIIISKIFKYKEKKELKIVLDKKYNKLLAQFSIDLKEKEIIERLSKFLRTPEKKYLLLLNPNIFHSTLNKLRELILMDKKAHLDSKTLYSLEHKLGFNKISRFSELNTTYDLPDGISVYVIFNKDLKLSGRIINTEEAIKVNLENRITENHKGRKALIYTHMYSGIYVFYTKVKKMSNFQLLLEHTFKLKALQRRSFFRKNVNLPVLIEKTGDVVQPVSTMIYDISGGGASIDNRNIGLNPHDDIKLSFPNNKILTLRLNAEVIRTSRNGKTAHIKFNHLKYSTQDRIIRLINK